jgi:hypothetical protein
MVNTVNLITVSKTESIRMTSPELVSSMQKAFEDNFAYLSGNQDDFLDAIFLFGAGRESLVMDVKNIVFKPMPFSQEELREIFAGMDDDCIEAMQDSMDNGTPLYAEIEGTPFPLRDTACLSIFQRIGIAGPALDAIPRDVLARHINEYAVHCKGKGLLIGNNRKIEALLGGNYRLLPAEDIMQKAAEYFKAMEGAEFSIGCFCHTRADAEWRTGLKALQLPLDTGLNGVMFEQTVRVSTSDCGTKAVTIAPQMREMFSSSADEYGLNYCLPMQMEHKGSASVENFEEQLTLIGKRFEDSTEIILKLADTNLLYPANVLLALMKWLRIPAKYGAEIYERRKAMWGDAEKSAYEVYGSLSEVLKYVMDAEKSMRNLAEYQDRFSRGLSFNYLKHDLPGSHSYNDRLIGIKVG